MSRQTDATSAVRTAIDRARAVGYEAGTHEELDRLATDLRAYATEMLPVAEAQTERMWHGSREQYVISSRLKSISTEAEQPLATGILAAHAQVRLLALDCEWLLTHYGPAPARSGSASAAHHSKQEGTGQRTAGLGEGDVAARL
ncbi:DUF6415 family natural product biosynthesis protein [Streptomyces sp. NPDC088341]|uniref:DUF6415 family natural product biosynthesis protein n=1 Tax=Streptomyces sp. NPDC088341 TaxID=3154870 RepID=UPI003439BC53